MKQKSILIIDDEKDFRTLLKKRISSWGFKCLTSASVEAALKRLKNSHPNLILLDLRLKKSDGIDFIQAIDQWADPNFPLPPILVISSENNREVVKYVLDLGAKGFIAKPYEPYLLASMIFNYID